MGVNHDYVDDMKSVQQTLLIVTLIMVQKFLSSSLYQAKLGQNTGNRPLVGLFVSEQHATFSMRP